MCLCVCVCVCVCVSECGCDLWRREGKREGVGGEGGGIVTTFSGRLNLVTATLQP